MSLEIRDKDVITFGDCKVDGDTVLDSAKQFKLCIRFDGAVELVEASGDYWFTDIKFNWHPVQKFNVLNCYDNSRGKYRSDEDIAFFIGNLPLLRRVPKKHRKYQFVECDYIDGEDKPPAISTDKLEFVIDKRKKVRIGYMIRRSNIGTNFHIQSYNAIDVHFHSDEGYYSQAVLFDKVNKNRLVMLGHQNEYAGAIGIPEMIFEDNYDKKVDKEFHENEYVRDFIRSNLIHCEEA